MVGEKREVPDEQKRTEMAERPLKVMLKAQRSKEQKVVTESRGSTAGRDMEDKGTGGRRDTSSACP